MRMIPPQPYENATKSERETFDLIRRSPKSNDYVCLHSLGLSNHEYKEYGEGDFIIIGPTGVFCLEVKGGLVSRTDGIWTIGWPGKSYTSKEGPFQQANSFRWSLSKDLEKRTGWKMRDKVLFGWGVVFPDITFDEADPEWGAAQVYDQRDKSNGFLDYVERLAEHAQEKNYVEKGWKPPGKLGRKDVEKIIEKLRPDFDLVPSVTGLLSESRRELITLGDDQYRALDYSLNDENPRLLCLGGAGTGKTVIALEAARRLVDSDIKVLLLCFNRFLAEHLKKNARAFGQNVTVFGIHQYLRSVIKSAGFSQELQSAESTYSAEELYGTEYPRLFDNAVLTLIEEGKHTTFDALIIDEAQDVLNRPLINCLSESLTGGFKDGRWVLFLDPELQADVYDKFDEELLKSLKNFGPHTISLKDNYRNPPEVVRHVSTLIGIEPPTCRRNLASTVEYKFHKTKKEEFRHLRAILVELLGQNIEPRSITILSPYKKSNTCLEGGDLELGKEIVDLSEMAPDTEVDAFTFSTVSAFKGLENEIIILMDLLLDDEGAWEKAVSYVGMTRARTKLYVLLRTDYERRIKSI
jgi:hypothetical protein